MELKNYQRNALNILKMFFERCRISGPAEAFKNITSEPEIAARLASLKSDYTAWDAIPNTPRVCIKVPTGGGKTILAAHAIKIAGETWCEKDRPPCAVVCAERHDTKANGRSTKKSLPPLPRGAQ